MIQGRPSSTAAFVALWRGLADCFPPEVRLCRDPFAWSFVPPRLARLQSLVTRHPRAASRALFASPLRRLLLWMQLRTRAIDDIAIAFAREGGRQIVLLGAGYDTRAARLAPDLGGCRFFEIDFPATQQRKRDILDRLAVAPRAAYVAWDFERHDVADLPAALVAHGLDPALRTLTIWEGVIPYLSEHAIERTLSAVRRMGAPGSLVMLHYIERARIESGTLWHVAASRMGEPLRFGWEPPALPGWLRTRGFELLSDRDDDELARSLFPPGWFDSFQGAGGRIALTASNATPGFSRERMQK